MKKKTLTIVAIAVLIAGFFIFTQNDDNKTPLQTDTGSNSSDIQAPMQIITAPGGATLALVPVIINGEGPFLFGLDTGASTTVIDDDIVAQLNLEVIGNAGAVAGVTGQTQAVLIKVDDWRLDQITLPDTQVVSIDLWESDQSGPVGLLGSDILSEYGAVTIDYDNAVIQLKERL